MQNFDNEKKNKRLFTGVAKSKFTIAIILNNEVFDTLIKEKLKKDTEMLAEFVYHQVPGVKEHYTFNKI